MIYDSKGESMLQIGMQTKDIVEDRNPLAGFELLNKAGFSCADFSLNAYLTNTILYNGERNCFFDKSNRELEDYFLCHKISAKKAAIKIHQMHMPYPMYIPNAKKELNEYLWNVVAPKSMEICRMLECNYIVVHGFKLARYLGTEDAEWKKTEEFLDMLAPIAKEMGITLCIENLYNSIGGHIVEGPCCNVWKTVERIDYMNEKYGAEVLGFCFDTGHANLIGIDFYEFITTLNHRLKVLHIHDNDGIEDLHQIPYTFTKTRENLTSTDWNGFIRGLRDIQYKGVLNFEASPVLSSFPEELKEDALVFIAKIGTYFSKQIS